MLGRTDAAETVLLSAGLGGAGSFWAPQVEALSRDYRVVLYDHRGTGANAGPLPGGYTIGHMAEDVIEILNALGAPRAHLLGHALGGLVALEVALRHPGRVGRVVVVNGWLKADSHTRRCFDTRLAALRGGGPGAYVRAQPIFLYPAAWLSAHALRVEAEEAHGLAHFQGEANLLARIGALLAYDASGTAGGVATPVLVAAARDDVLVPWTASEAMARALPKARLWLVPEGGHAFTVVEPAPFNAELLRFLAEPA
ncbi:pyrimidine utilization protein D [Teichococcus wenyumeiae]|uniref:pyrimidine utilization protein D n=1 Tax=Teichococcus wenyumeiae TaxID=2478470 RepID=UPI001F3606B7|nr:pyrimidine utilization protein D [Pseudoroseomonas wenyumeiae]